MLTITNILNPLTGGATTETHKWVKGKPLSHYFPYDGECIVQCGGEAVKHMLDEVFPARGEHYTVLPVPEGVDRQTLRILGHTAMSGLGAFVPGWGAPVGWVGSNLINLFLQDKDKDQSTSQSYSWRYVSSLTASHGLAMPVIYGKARVRPTLKNRYVKVEGDKQRLYALYGVSAHYVKERTVSPWLSLVVYTIGDEVTVPTFGAGYTQRCTSQNGDVWVDGHGTASFADRGIIINSRAIEGYGDDVDWDTRPGLAEQVFVAGFDATYANFADSTGLYLDYPEVKQDEVKFVLLTSTMTLTFLDHQLLYRGAEYSIHGGDKQLYISNIGKTHYIYWNPSGDVLPNTEYGLAVDTLPEGCYAIYIFKLTATKLTGKVFPSKSNTPVGVDWYKPVLLLQDTHNIELIFEFPNGLYQAPPGDDITRETARIFAQYREYDSADTRRWYDFTFDKLNESKGDYSKIDPATGIGIRYIVRKKPEPFFISAKAVNENEEFLDPSKQYEVRVSASSPCIVKLVNAATIVYGEENEDGERPGFSYPGEALLGIKALASGQISSDLDVQVDVERDGVWVYDEDAADWVYKAANNHAWAVYDILVQGSSDHPAYPTHGNYDAEAIYGCGISREKVDYTSFKEWADNITSIGYKLNIVFDTAMSAWDAILRICQEGRGMIYPVGAKIHAFVDKEGDVSQIFTMGNIHSDTFVQKFVGGRNKANMIEATYYEQENGYAKTTIAARTANWDSSAVFNTPVSVTFYGIVAFQQAMSQAWFLLRGNELLNNVVSFGVDVDALAVRAGDVVEVQHDALTSGWGGRLLDVKTNLIRNPSWEASINENWAQWGTPTERTRYSTHHYDGSWSYGHTANTENAGSYQSGISLRAGQVYTLSCYVWLISSVADGTGIRLQIYVDGKWQKTTNSTDFTITGAWQRISVTFTPSTDMTRTLYIGGIGECYFDAIMINPAATACSFMLYNLVTVTLDRTVTLVTGTQYELKIWHNDGTIETQHPITGGAATDQIAFGSHWDWDKLPSIYEPYSFGVRGVHLNQYRVAKISRTSELMRTLTLVQYDAALYDGWTPDSAELFPLAKAVPEPRANLLNTASNVQLREVISRNRVTGEYMSSIVVTWDAQPGDPRGAWEVYFRDVDMSDVNWKGTWEVETEYNTDDKVELGGRTYISLEDNNTSEPVLI